MPYLLRLWFGFTAPVGRGAYAISGFGLMLFKYGVEALVIWLHPPHLDGYLRSNRSEFLLVALPGGRTRLEGRTWYEFEMFPQSYWTLWSNLIIHRIHQRVLLHVKQLAEGN